MVFGETHTYTNTVWGGGAYLFRVSYKQRGMGAGGRGTHIWQVPLAERPEAEAQRVLQPPRAAGAARREFANSRALCSIASVARAGVPFSSIQLNCTQVSSTAPGTPRPTGEKPNSEPSRPQVDFCEPTPGRLLPFVLSLLLVDLSRSAVFLKTFPPPCGVRDLAVQL